MPRESDVGVEWWTDGDLPANDVGERPSGIRGRVGHSYGYNPAVSPPRRAMESRRWNGNGHSRLGGLPHDDSDF